MTFDNKIKQAELLQQEIAQLRPFNKNILEQLKEYYRIGLTYTSNALEGNSLTETETKIVLEDGITIGGKPLKEHLEVIGHSDAFDCMYELVHHKTITLQNILHLHKLFYYRIDTERAGVMRKDPIFVTGTDFEFPAPSKIPELMHAFIHELSTLQKHYHPIEYAARAHVQLVTIHPFVDGNGRTARLLMNTLLMQHGYTVVVIPPIVRREYIAAIKAGNSGNYEPFINFLSCMVYEALLDYQRLFKTLTTY